MSHYASRVLYFSSFLGTLENPRLHSDVSLTQAFSDYSEQKVTQDLVSMYAYWVKGHMVFSLLGHVIWDPEKFLVLLHPKIILDSVYLVWDFFSNFTQKLFILIYGI